MRETLCRVSRKNQTLSWRVSSVTMTKLMCIALRCCVGYLCSFLLDNPPQSVAWICCNLCYPGDCWVFHISWVQFYVPLFYGDFDIGLLPVELCLPSCEGGRRMTCQCLHDQNKLVVTWKWWFNGVDGFLALFSSCFYFLPFFFWTSGRHARKLPSFLMGV